MSKYFDTIPHADLLRSVARRIVDRHVLWLIGLWLRAPVEERDGDRNRRMNVEIVKRSDAARFIVLPKRWIVERTIAWLNRCRRLAKEWERLNRNALAFLRWASIRLVLRRLCQSTT